MKGDQVNFQEIIYEKKDGVARIIINRPKVHNAFRMQTIMEMSQAWDDAEADKNIGVVITTGAGDKAFSSGGDVNWEKDRGDTVWTAVNDLYIALRRVSKPTIAVVRGWCMGGANVLALLHDLTIAGESAKFAQTGPKMGSFNTFGAGYLSRVIGEKRAREFWLLCRTYNAQEALQMGLVNWVVPDDRLDAEVDKVSKEILALSPTALRCIKLHFQADTDKYEGLWEIGRVMAVLYQETEEAKEGMNSFLEKRKPDFFKHYKPI